MKKLNKTLVALCVLSSAVSVNALARTYHHHANQPAAHVASVSSTIEINRAGVAEIAKLKGVGPKKAQAIVDYRQANGSFSDAKSLAKVKGIGEKMLARIERENPGKLKFSS